VSSFDTILIDLPDGGLFAEGGLLAGLGVGILINFYSLSLTANKR
jgi:hypothetical protein